MDFTGKKLIFFSRPADKSLTAYKDWINSMTEALGASDDGLSEEGWEKEWQKFWASATPDNSITKEEL